MSEYFSRLSVPCRTVLCLWENAASVVYLPVFVVSPAVRHNHQNAKICNPTKFTFHTIVRRR